MIKIPILRNALLISILILGLSSCFGSKPVAYFNQGVIDTAKIQAIKVPEQVIQKGDLLTVTIFSDNPDATAIYNQASGAIPPSSTNSGVTKSVNPGQSGGGSGSGYLVDYNGNIRLHALGLVKAEGSTKDQLAESIIGKLNALGVLTNPYAIVRFSNFKITVLGEVKTPGVFTVPSEKASILEAIGLAGDITDYGLKDRVLLIREDQDNRTYHRINLLDPNVFGSPYFYLRQNDILIIEPDNRKPTALDLQTLQYITVAATLASTAAILITLFK